MHQGRNMSIKHSLMALLEEGDRYGYELRSHFEARTGGTWPLNIGQVYSTLERLERGGLITRSDAADERQVHYALTPAGRAEVAEWWASPVPLAAPGRDDMALKVALAVHAPSVDVVRVIQIQRLEVMRRLQEINRAKRASSGEDTTWELVADAMIFRAEAEIRWLDHTEQRIASAVPSAKPPTNAIESAKTAKAASL
jgi:DNA-binding PadR family transcriptional regulator